jgi:hypothetical protein
VRISKRNRWKFVLLFLGTILLGLSSYVRAQEEEGEAPLGDVARSFRKKTAPAEAVIDNDNLSKVVDDAGIRRAAGSSPVFSLDPGERSFNLSSPDVTCSLSFSGKTTLLVSDPLLLDELPRSEVSKLEGPATIDGDSLQVSMHNGTAWDLREVVIGLTIVKRPQMGEPSPSDGLVRIVPAVAGGESQSGQFQNGQFQNGQSQPGTFQKQPDVTLLLRAKGSAAPAATAVFRTPLNFSLFPDQEWHWAIVRAKGIPPQTLPDVTHAGPQYLQPGPGDAAVQAPLLTPVLSASPPRLVPSNSTATR